MNRYSGNTGYMGKVQEPPYSRAPGREERGRGEPGREERGRKKPSGLADIVGGLGGILSRVNAAVPENEDLLLIAVLYLLYKESGDIEFLLIAGALLFM